MPLETPAMPLETPAMPVKQLERVSKKQVVF
jgi:hypothetical protein